MLVDHQGVGEGDDVGWQRGIRCQVHDDPGTSVERASRGGCDDMERHLELQQHSVARTHRVQDGKITNRHGGVGAGDDDDRVLAGLVDRDERMTRDAVRLCTDA